MKIVPAMRLRITEPDADQGATIVFNHLSVRSHSSEITYKPMNAIAIKENESLILGVENGELKIDILKRGK